jgi:hypothetical protein
MAPRQGLTFYVLSEDIIRRRIKRYNLELRCYLCGGTLQVGDSIVRKRRKLYHRTCWENSFLDIPEDILDEEDLRLIENGSIPVSSTFSITTTISNNTIPSNTITFGVANTRHAHLNQKH